MTKSQKLDLISALSQKLASFDPLNQDTMIQEREFQAIAWNVRHKMMSPANWVTLADMLS